MRLLIDRMTHAMRGADAKKRQRAWAVLATMVGAITIARALPEGAERHELVEAALASALETAGI
jgi:TetR/AcrR family transcriptional regulator, transcriptional repressor for nem operon